MSHNAGFDYSYAAAPRRGFTLLTPERRRQVAISGHVDEDFLRLMALLLDAHPNVALLSGITSAEIRDHLQFCGAHHGVGKELMLNGGKMAETIIAERASVGERTLCALKIARSISSPSGHEALVPHLEAIEREFKHGRRKRASGRKSAATCPSARDETSCSRDRSPARRMLNRGRTLTSSSSVRDRS